MADTIRTRAALLALLADNSSGLITAQTIRDALVSLFGVYGGIYVEDGAAAQAVTTTPALLTGFAANGLFAGTVPDHAADTITLPNAGIYAVQFDASFGGDGAAATYRFVLRQNGVAVPGASCRTRLAAGEVHAASFLALVNVAANDALSVYVQADASRNLTVVDAALHAQLIS